MNLNRRSFLRASGAAAAPFILPSAVRSAETKPNDRITMGFIGMGIQNGGLMRNFIGQDKVQVLAVCDVDTTRRNAAQKRANDFYTGKPDKGSADVAAYNAYEKIIARDDIDAVCIATPDHWHAIITLAALAAGKDVYCEKPLTHNIYEAKLVIDAVAKHKRVLQTGSMQRSWLEFRTACELVRNGVAGKIRHVTCTFGDPMVPCDLPGEAEEPGLDWERWVGPARMRPYHSVLSPRGVHRHFPNWRAYMEFGGGRVTDIGAHHLDIAQWGLGMDGSGPVKIDPPKNKGDKRGSVMTYANGITVSHDEGFGMHFYGDKGEVKVNRGKFELVIGGKSAHKFTRREDGGSLARACTLADKEFLGENATRLYHSRNHIQNFLECAQTRKRPITSEIEGGGTAICCHLMNLAYFHHASINWNPEQKTFAKGSGKPEWLTREYRAPYLLG